MKKLLLLSLLISGYHSLIAQSSVDVSLLRTWDYPSPRYTDKGYGGLFNILSRKISVTGKEDLSPINIQFGGGMYMSSFGHVTLHDVPLLPPENGMAKVRVNNINGDFHALARISTPVAAGARMPYVDLIGGGRFISGSMTVTQTSGFTNNTNSSGSSGNADNTLKGSWEWNYGIGAGMMFRTSPTSYFDAELIWTCSPHLGEMVDLSTVTKDASGIYYDPKKTPVNMMLLKIGFNFDCVKGESDTGSHHSTYHSSGIHSYGGHSGSVHVSTGGAHVGVAK